MSNCLLPAPVLKAAGVLSILLLCSVMPQDAPGESGIRGTVINEATRIEKGTNIAAGQDNSAAHSSLIQKNVKISGTVVNTVQSNAAVNLAVGNRNQANQSAVVSKNSKVAGSLVNSSQGGSRVNMATGTGNTADQGSVRIESSRVGGTVMNSVKVDKSANLAVGERNTASQAAVVLGGTQLSGRVINTAAGDNAVNAAVGYRNEANQSSIVIDGSQGGSGKATAMQHSVFHAESGPGLVRQAGSAAQLTKGPEAGQHVPGQVVFLVDNNKAGLAGLDRIARKYHLRVGEKTVLKSLNRVMVVSETARDGAEIAEMLKKEPGVYTPQPNYVFATMGGQDPLSSMQSLVPMLNLQEVHGKVSGKKIKVAVVDTGVEVGHEDLRARIVGYHNFISGSTYEGEIHGTAVAGIIGAARNEHGIVGIAPDVSLLALRACRQINKVLAIGECFSTSLARSLDTAISARVDVVNLSLGAYVNDTLLGMMFDSGHEKGIVFAAPVGNDPAAESMAFPASHDKVVSVAGLDQAGNPLPNRRLASMADAVAPATHLLVTTPGNSYNFIDGTSLASGAISGIMALSMERKTARNPSSCLPRFNSPVPWSRQVFSCMDL